MAFAQFLLFFVAMVIFFPAQLHADSSAKEVIARVMHAYGGKNAVEEIQAVCGRGRIVAFAFNAEGTYSYCVARNRKLRVDINYGSFAEHRVLNGQRAWVQQGDGSSQVLSAGPDYRSVVYQYEQMSLPWLLLTQAGRVHYEGRRQLNDRPVDVLSLETGNSPLLKISIDAASGRIVQTSGVFRMGGTQMVLSSEFHDFRSVGKTVFPFKLINYAGGEKIAETTIQGYELNPRLRDETFRMGANAVSE